jgi:hypothetical protein
MTPLTTTQVCLKYCVLSLCQVLTHPNHHWLSPIFNPSEPNHEIEGGFWVILTNRSVDNDVNMFPTRPVITLIKSNRGSMKLVNTNFRT